MKHNVFFSLPGALLVASLIVLYSQSVVLCESPDQLVVIVNRNFKVDSLSVAEVRRIFKKEITVYKGVAVRPIHAPSGSPLRNQFLSQVMGMSSTAEEKYWEEAKVKKGVSPPIQLSNTVRAVFAAPGAISYCYRKEFNPTVAKIILSL
ncbi:MAG: hypothetical protein JXX14_02655 [Deltaproteobacteria bacterium]|nr:hypothetical protein [Deltaproteobacteria bacterium]